MPWSMSTQNEKLKKLLWVFVYIKYGKFGSVSQGHFTKHKHLISEEWLGKYYEKFRRTYSAWGSVISRYFYDLYARNCNVFSNHYSIDLAVQWMISLWGLIYRHLLTPKMVFPSLSYNSQAEAAAGDSST